MPALFPVPEGRIRILDGGLGTELQRFGLPIGLPSDGLNLSHPDAVQEVSEQYAAAGAQVLTTNTFRSNLEALGAIGASGDRVQLNCRGVELARAAAGPDRFVVGSVGPAGPVLSAGQILRLRVKMVLGSHCDTLAQHGVDAILLETFTDLAEIRLVARWARHTGLPVIASMSFDAGPDGTLTLRGNTPEIVAQSLTRIGVDAIGVNCGQGPDAALRVARRMRAASPLPLWFKPNAGLPRLVDGKAHYDLPDDALARLLPELLELGVAFVGGCCGTTPVHIRTLSDAARRLGVVADSPPGGAAG